MSHAPCGVTWDFWLKRDRGKSLKALRRVLPKDSPRVALGTDQRLRRKLLSVRCRAFFDIPNELDPQLLGPFVRLALFDRVTVNGFVEDARLTQGMYEDRVILCARILILPKSYLVLSRVDGMHVVPVNRRQIAGEGESAQAIFGLYAGILAGAIKPQPLETFAGAA